MARSFAVRFVDEPEQPFDQVVVAVAAIDAFSGRVVARGVEATIEGLPNLPYRNLSGLLVFVNLPVQADYRIRVQARAAGYFDPDPVTFVPPPDDDPDLATRRRLSVPLFRRPETAAAAGGTAVAGVIVRGAAPVSGASIEAELPTDLLPPRPPGAPPLRPFETRSDERGAFGLSLRLPRDPTNEPVAVTFTFSEGADERRIERPVVDGRLHSFEKPIDLTGAGVPGLLPFGA